MAPKTDKKGPKIQQLPKDPSEPALPPNQSTLAVLPGTGQVRIAGAEAAKKKKKTVSEQPPEADDGPGTSTKPVRKKTASGTQDDGGGHASSSKPSAKPRTAVPQPKPTPKVSRGSASKARDPGAAPGYVYMDVTYDIPTIPASATVSARDRRGSKTTAAALGDISLAKPARSQKALEEEAEYQPSTGEDDMPVDEKPVKRKGKATAGTASNMVMGDLKVKVAKKRGKKEAKPKKTVEEVLADQEDKEAEELGQLREEVGESLRNARTTRDGVSKDPLALVAQEAFLGYALIPLIEGWHGARYRVHNQRKLEEDERITMANHWKLTSPNYVAKDAIINVSIRAKHVDRSSLVGTYDTADDLTQLVVLGEKDKDYAFHVLGGNHRRVVYADVMDYYRRMIKELTAKLEELDKVQKADKNRPSETKDEAQLVISTQAAIARHQQLLDRGPVWAVAVYDKDNMTPDVELLLSANEERIFVRATQAEIMWKEIHRIFAFEQSGLQRGTLAWDEAYKSGSNVVNQDFIYKNVSICGFLMVVGKYGYWRNGDFIHPRSLKDKFRDEYGGFIMMFIMEGVSRLDEITSNWIVGDIEARCAWEEKHDNYQKIVRRDALKSEVERQIAAEEHRQTQADIKAGLADPDLRTNWTPQVLEKIENIWVTKISSLNTAEVRKNVLFDPYSVEWNRIMDEYANVLLEKFPDIAKETMLFRTDEQLQEAMDRIRFSVSRRDRPRLPIITAKVVDSLVEVLRDHSDGIKEVIRWIDPWTDYLAVPAKKVPEFFDRSYNLLHSFVVSQEMTSKMAEKALTALLFTVLENRQKRLLPLDTAVNQQTIEHPCVKVVLHTPNLSLSKINDPSSLASENEPRQEFFFDQTPQDLAALNDSLVSLCVIVILPAARTHSLKNPLSGWEDFPSGSKFADATTMNENPILHMFFNTLLYPSILPFNASAPRDAGARMPILITLWAWYLSVTLPLVKVKAMEEFYSAVMVSISEFSKVKSKALPENDSPDADLFDHEYFEFKTWDSTIRASLLEQVSELESVEMDPATLRAIRAAAERDKILYAETETFFKSVRKMESARAVRGKPPKGGPVIDDDVVDAAFAFAKALQANVRRQYLREFPKNKDLPIVERYGEQSHNHPPFPGKTQKDPLYFETFEDAKEAIDKMKKAQRKAVAWNDSWEHPANLERAYDTTAAAPSGSSGTDWKQLGLSSRIKKKIPRVHAAASVKGKEKAADTESEDEVDQAMALEPDVRQDDVDMDTRRRTRRRSQPVGTGKKDADDSEEQDEEVVPAKQGEDDSDSDEDDDQAKNSEADEGEDKDESDEGGNGDVTRRSDDASEDDREVPPNHNRRGVRSSDSGEDSSSDSGEDSSSDSGEDTNNLADRPPLEEVAPTSGDDEPDTRSSPPSSGLPPRNRSSSSAVLLDRSDPASEEDDRRASSPSPTQPTAGGSNQREIGKLFSPGESQEIRAQLGSMSLGDQEDVMDTSPDISGHQSHSPPPAPQSSHQRRSERRVRGSSVEPTPVAAKAKPRTNPRTYGKSTRRPFSSSVEPVLPPVPEDTSRPATPTSKRPVQDISPTSKPPENESKRSRKVSRPSLTHATVESNDSQHEHEPFVQPALPAPAAGPSSARTRSTARTIDSARASAPPPSG
ncbi:hypothetical protein EIP91_004925 [Steccherinum ochraceum]|uniref:Uncharacterized protein n=1 Tax=Steccherinum ochraceum TaxID=92696 RepID=A0A4R0RAY2_9APHY|nr:hypothetical protein EIP91_004925 [Steccherinum ochraceum]